MRKTRDKGMEFAGTKMGQNTKATGKIIRGTAWVKCSTGMVTSSKVTFRMTSGKEKAN